MAIEVGFGSDRRVLTNRGELPLSKVRVGDVVYGDLEGLESFTGVAPFGGDHLKKIRYRDFDSGQITSLMCIPGEKFRMLSIGVKPYCRGNIVYWFTRCIRKNLGTDSIQEGLHEAVESTSESIRAQGADDTTSSVDSDGESSDEELCWIETNQSGDSEDASLQDTIDLDPHAGFEDKLTNIRHCLDQKGCPCKGFRKVSAQFANRDEAELALELLLSAHHDDIDPSRVFDLDVFCMSVEEHRLLCDKRVKRRYIEPE